MEEKTKTELFVERACKMAEELGIGRFMAYASEGDKYTFASKTTLVDVVTAVMEMADSEDPSYRKAVLAAASLIEAKQAKEAGKEADDED